MRQPQAPDDNVLAWELAATVRPFLSQDEADRIYICIGIGETFEAIDRLITIIARDRISMGEDMAATVTAWLDCYVGQTAEQRLRPLVAAVEAYTNQQMSATAIAPVYPEPSEYRGARSG